MLQESAFKVDKRGHDMLARNIGGGTYMEVTLSKYQVKSRNSSAKNSVEYVQGLSLPAQGVYWYAGEAPEPVRIFRFSAGKLSHWRSSFFLAPFKSEIYYSAFRLLPCNSGAVATLAQGRRGSVRA